MKTLIYQSMHVRVAFTGANNRIDQLAAQLHDMEGELLDGTHFIVYPSRISTQTNIPKLIRQLIETEIEESRQDSEV